MRMQGVGLEPCWCVETRTSDEAGPPGFSPLQLSAREIIELSPQLAALPPKAPPMCVAYGEDETAEFVRQSVDFLTRWSREGLVGELSGLPGRDHFSIVMDLSRPESQLVQKIAGFIESGEQRRLR